MELTQWRLLQRTFTMEVTSRTVHHGSYLMELTPWKLAHGTYTMEIT